MAPTAAHIAAFSAAGQKCSMPIPKCHTKCALTRHSLFPRARISSLSSIKSRITPSRYLRGIQKDKLSRHLSVICRLGARPNRQVFPTNSDDNIFPPKMTSTKATPKREPRFIAEASGMTIANNRTWLYITQKRSPLEQALSLARMMLLSASSDKSSKLLQVGGLRCAALVGFFGFRFSPFLLRITRSPGQNAHDSLERIDGSMTICRDAKILAAIPPMFVAGFPQTGFDVALLFHAIQSYVQGAVGQRSLRFPFICLPDFAAVFLSIDEQPENHGLTRCWYSVFTHSCAFHASTTTIVYLDQVSSQLRVPARARSLLGRGSCHPNRSGLQPQALAVVDHHADTAVEHGLRLAGQAIGEAGEVRRVGQASLSLPPTEEEA